jgi:hypothetical protein
MRKVTVCLVVLLALVSGALYAAQFNAASLQGMISANYPDCTGCWAPAGCYLEIGTNGGTGGDPFYLHVADTTCSSIQAGDCLQATGEVTATLLFTPSPISQYQVEVSSWSVQPAAACQP